jgi:hypothetical protein
MQVSKSILTVGAAIILLLTAAVAYLVGKSDQATPAPQAENNPVPSIIPAPPKNAALPQAVVKEVEALPPAQEEPKTRSVVPYSKTVTAAEQKLVDAWFETEEGCRGSSDEASIEKWCRLREIEARKMNKAGICYGRGSDQSAAEHDIHHCGPDSYR